MIRKLCTLLVAALWIVSLEGPALAQAQCSQAGIGFNYAGPYDIGSCGLFATCAVESCTDLYESPPTFCHYCADYRAPSDGYDCYYFYPSAGCACQYEQDGLC